MSTNANPVLSVDKNGFVIYSNVVENPLLKEWGIAIGEKLPSNIEDLVQKVISQNSPEKIKIKVGSGVYLLVFHPLPDQECASVSGFDISDQRELDEKSHMSEEKYQEIFDLIEEGIAICELVLDEAGLPIDVIILEANPAYEKHSGFRREQVIGRSLKTVFSTIEQIWLDRCFEAIHTGMGTYFEEYNAYLDRWFGVFASPMGSNCFIAVFNDITGRKRVEESELRAEEALALERSQLISIFDGMEDLVYVADPYTYEILYTNKALKEKFGGEYEGEICYSKFQRRDSPCNFCTNQIILKERDKPYIWEYYNPIINRYLLIMDRIIKWPDGRDVRLEIAKDITERKSTEEVLKKANETLEEKVLERTLELKEAYSSLKESENNFAEAQKLAHIGNWEWNMETDKAFWSDELYRIFGRDPQELAPPYNEYLSYVHPADRENADNAHKEALNGRPFSLDHRIILPDGEERTIHMKTEVVFDENNVPVKLKGTVQDISDRKKTEEKIQYLANIVESSKDAIVTVSLDGIVTSWNKGAEQTFGYTAEEILGKKVTLLEPDNLRGDIKHLIQQVKQGKKIKDYESSRKKKDGTVVIISGTISQVLDTSGKLVAISVIARDITDKKRAEEAMANIEIARKQEIHHRIKNNLQVISSLLDLQAEKFNGKKNIKDSEVLEAFKESQDRVISMALIHEELHKGGRLDTLKFSHYIKRLADNLFLTYRLGNEGIVLITDVEEDVFFDLDTAVPLGIIINELISNSLKHAFPGRNEGEIRIKLNRHELDNCKNEENCTTYILSVSDNGVGIPEDIDINNLESLGLQLIFTLTEQLDGILELERQNGTEFIIRFNVTGNNDQKLIPGQLQFADNE